MGATLSAPVELVRIQRHGSAAFRVGAAEMQGWRNGHEDAHTVQCADTAGAFWVLDGHGGDAAALYGAPKLGEEFAATIKGGNMPENTTIEDGLISVDKNLREYFKQRGGDSGATVVGAMAAMQDDGTYSMKLINCGDSRALIVRGPQENEGTAKPTPLKVPTYLTDLLSDPVAVSKGDAANQCSWPLVQETVDHKPSHPAEKGRIVAAGGHVTDDDPPRLDGNLAVSRGLGDFEYKSSVARAPADQKVSCVPDIYEISGLQPGSICVLCCDGVWDVMTGQEVGVMVRKALTEDPKADLGEIAHQIIFTSLDRNSGDNITAMVVQLGEGNEWEAKPPLDEMKGFERLVGEQALDDDVKNKYTAMLNKWNFPKKPICCDVCDKWNSTMYRCPCQEAVYCSKHCQKIGWNTHKNTCSLRAK